MQKTFSRLRNFSYFNTQSGSAFSVIHRLTGKEGEKGHFKTSSYFRWFVFFCLFFTVLNFILISVFWNRLPPEVPLFYSRPWGEEILAPPLALLLLPLSSLLVLVVNLLLLIILNSNRLLTNILGFCPTLFSFLAFLDSFKIITLIT